MSPPDQRRSLRLPHPIPARCRIGRSPGTDIQIERPEVSAEHALISWDGHQWLLRDLGSTNGTFIDGTKVAPGRAVPISAGSAIAFGDPSLVWNMYTDEPPVAVAIREDGIRVLLEDGYLRIPCATGENVLIYSSTVNGWQISDSSGSRPARDRQDIDIAGHRWTLHLPDLHTHTRPITGPPTILTDVQLRLAPSRNGEHIPAYLIERGVERPLGAYTDGELLLYLARERLKDQKEGVSPAEQGWRDRDDAVRAAGCKNKDQLNLWVHRIRQRLHAEGILDAENIIERRSSNRELRLGLSNIILTEE